MTKRTRAIDFMWQDAAYPCGIDGQFSERSEIQTRLSDSLNDIANDPKTPLHIIEAIGYIVRQAYDIGYEQGKKR